MLLHFIDHFCSPDSFRTQCASYYVILQPSHLLFHTKLPCTQLTHPFTHPFHPFTHPFHPFTHLTNIMHSIYLVLLCSSKPSSLFYILLLTPFLIYRAHTIFKATLKSFPSTNLQYYFPFAQSIIHQPPIHQRIPHFYLLTSQPAIYFQPSPLTSTVLLHRSSLFSPTLNSYSTNHHHQPQPTTINPHQPSSTTINTTTSRLRSRGLRRRHVQQRVGQCRWNLRGLLVPSHLLERPPACSVVLHAR